MALHSLQHYTIEPADLEVTKDFYVEVLGLEVGDRPPLNFPGYWLYADGQAVVHLLGVREPREDIVVRPVGVPMDGTGRFDHVAFATTDLPGVRERLRRCGASFREHVLPRVGATQIFLVDPDGIGVELNFPPAETGT